MHRSPLPFALYLALGGLTACSSPPAVSPAGADQTPHETSAAAAEGAETIPWSRLPAPTDLPADRPLNTAFLIVDGVYNTELTAPYDVFQHTANHARPAPGMKVFTVSQDGGPITTYEGLTLQPHYSFQNAPAIDILVVPSAEHSRDTDRENRELISWVRQTGEEARYVMSLCWGAFILAEAGLLDGGACTTFPSDFDSFAETFPHLDVERGASFVHAGKAITSQGGAKSFDAAMYLVDHLYGEKAAQGIGGGLLIPWPPAAGAVEARVIPPTSE